MTSVVALSGKPLLGLIMFLSAARGVLDGLFQFTGSPGAGLAAGIVASIIAGLALYAGTAFLVEELRHRAVLPVFRRGASATAVGGELRDQLLPATAEAGIREQL